MTTVHDLPFGADSPDELLAAYANGSLSPAERAEVDRWLAAHPEWTRRLNAYRAIGSAVRQSAATSASPDIESLGGVWTAIDAQPQARPLRPAAPSAAPATSAGGPAGRSTNWLLGIAAALLVAVAATSVVVATRQSDDDSRIAARRDTTTSPEEASGGAPPPDAEGSAEPGSEAPTTSAADSAQPPPPAGGGDDADALRRAAADTAEQSTAQATLDIVGVADVSGTVLADIFAADEVTMTIDGTGQLEFPNRAQYDTKFSLTGGSAVQVPAQPSSTVQEGDQTWVQCPGADYVPLDEAACTGIPFGTEFFGPLAALEVLGSAEGAIRYVGDETVGGIETRRYELETMLPDETGELREITTNVWIGIDDGLIHNVTEAGDIVVIVPANEAIPEPVEVPTALQITYELSQFGAPVDIPDLG